MRVQEVWIVPRDGRDSDPYVYASVGYVKPHGSRNQYCPRWDFSIFLQKKNKQCWKFDPLPKRSAYNAKLLMGRFFI